MFCTTEPADITDPSPMVRARLDEVTIVQPVRIAAFRSMMIFPDPP